MSDDMSAPRFRVPTEAEIERLVASLSAEQRELLASLPGVRERLERAFGEDVMPARPLWPN